MKISKASIPLLFAGGLLLAGAASATEPTVTVVKPAKSDATSNLKVARDAETGRLRPTTEQEDAELAAARRNNTNGVVVVSRPNAGIARLADGTVVGRRSEEDLDELVAVQTADGKLKVEHASKAAATKNTTVAEEK